GGAAAGGGGGGGAARSAANTPMTVRGVGSTSVAISGTITTTAAISTCAAIDTSTVYFERDPTVTVGWLTSPKISRGTAHLLRNDYGISPTSQSVRHRARGDGYPQFVQACPGYGSHPAGPWVTTQCRVSRRFGLS